MSLFRKIPFPLQVFIVILLALFVYGFLGPALVSSGSTALVILAIFLLFFCGWLLIKLIWEM